MHFLSHCNLIPSKEAFKNVHDTFKVVTYAHVPYAAYRFIHLLQQPIWQDGVVEYILKEMPTIMAAMGLGYAMTHCLNHYLEYRHQESAMTDLDRKMMALIKKYLSYAMAANIGKDLTLYAYTLSPSFLAQTVGLTIELVGIHLLKDDPIPTEPPPTPLVPVTILLEKKKSKRQAEPPKDTTKQTTEQKQSTAPDKAADKTSAQETCVSSKSLKSTHIEPQLFDEVMKRSANKKNPEMAAHKELEQKMGCSIEMKRFYTELTKWKKRQPRN